jgi:hypothetical protein
MFLGKRRLPCSAKLLPSGDTKSPHATANPEATMIFYSKISMDLLSL